MVLSRTMNREQSEMRRDSPRIETRRQFPTRTKLSFFRFEYQLAKRMEFFRLLGFISFERFDARNHGSDSIGSLTFACELVKLCSLRDLEVGQSSMNVYLTCYN